MRSTRIEWTDETWNPVTGCTPVSPGCDRCYARRMARRLRGRAGYPEDDPFRPGVEHQDKWRVPFNWASPRRVFVCSMGDLFHDDVPDRAIAKVVATARDLPQHTFQLLTKRPERMRPAMYAEKVHHLQAMAMGEERRRWPLSNLWLGVTAEDQERWDERVPMLLDIPAAVRFVSCEPLLGMITPKKALPDWLIVGGETGSKGRPMRQKWVDRLYYQAMFEGVPFFFKKWGSAKPAGQPEEPWPYPRAFPLEAL